RARPISSASERYARWPPPAANPSSSTSADFARPRRKQASIAVNRLFAQTYPLISAVASDGIVAAVILHGVAHVAGHPHREAQQVAHRIDQHRLPSLLISERPQHPRRHQPAVDARGREPCEASKRISREQPPHQTQQSKRNRIRQSRTEMARWSRAARALHPAQLVAK